jgi:chromatin segregation and condensation protein Rec8/ScpA/Scc1 (kleisin family)
MVALSKMGTLNKLPKGKSPRKKKSRRNSSVISKLKLDFSRILKLRRKVTKAVEIKQKKFFSIQDHIKEILHNYRNRNKFRFKISQLLMLAIVMDLCGVSSKTKKRLFNSQKNV